VLKVPAACGVVDVMKNSSLVRAAWLSRARGVLILVVLLGALAGCNSVPAECQQQHSKAVAALQSKDKNSFRSLVLPAQRSGPLRLPATLGIKSSKKVDTLTLDDVLDIQFFREAKGVTVNTDLKDMDDKTSARLGATFDFGSSSAVRSLILKKEGNDWLVDMKATLEWWGKINGGDAFTAVGLK
jgi:hypothetical protein